MSGSTDPVHVELSHVMLPRVGRADVLVTLRHVSQLDVTGAVLELALAGPARLSR